MNEGEERRRECERDENDQAEGEGQYSRLTRDDYVIDNPRNQTAGW
jgi:hypothetical protein